MDGFIFTSITSCICTELPLDISTKVVFQYITKSNIRWWIHNKCYRTNTILTDKCNHSKLYCIAIKRKLIYSEIPIILSCFVSCTAQVTAQVTIACRLSAQQTAIYMSMFIQVVCFLRTEWNRDWTGQFTETGLPGSAQWAAAPAWWALSAGLQWTVYFGILSIQWWSLPRTQKHH